MSRVVLVMGLPGSGKTFFAKRLAERLDGIHVSSDMVRRDIEGSGKYTPQKKILVYEEMLRRTSELVSENKTVVVDATFHRQEARNLFVEDSRLKGTQLKVILVRADESVVVRRLRQPRPDSEADFKVYLKIKNEFEPVSIPHLSLVSTDSNIDDMMEEAVAFLAQ